MKNDTTHFGYETVEEREKPRRVADVFDSVASRYDLMNDLMSGGMAQAANELMKHGGGQVVVKDGRVIGLVELAIAGLMSTENVRIVAEETKGALDGFRACGCTLNNPNVLLSFLALTVIPELRISDMGLVDVERFELVTVLEKA